jgi:hypothetical protein
MRFGNHFIIFTKCARRDTMRKNKKVMLIILMTLVIFMSGVNWMYPFSSFSIKKSFSYLADPLVVEQYRSEVDDFKKVYGSSDNGGEKIDLTMDRVKYILEQYEQIWIMSEEPTKVSQDSLDSILFELKEVRKLTIELTYEESYNDAKDFLRMMLEKNIALEEEVHVLKDSTFHSYITLSRQMGNLHMGFIQSFGLFTSFYEEYSKAM